MKEQLEVEVQRMGGGGESVAKAADSSMVVFVPYGAPGDKLLVEVTESEARFKRAKILKVLEAGPGRAEAPCPIHFRPESGERWCGGCDWQQLGYPAQLEQKRELVRDALAKIAKLKIDVLPTLPSPEPMRYRNKVQVPVRPNGTGLQAGFYHPGTHDLVPFEDCLVQPELSVRIVRFIKEMGERRGWTAYDEKTRRGWLKHIFVRTSREGHAIVALVCGFAQFPDHEAVVAELRKAFPQIVGVHQNLQPIHTNVVFGPKWIRIWGKNKLRERVGRLTLAASPSAFLQVNTPASEVLYDTAKAFLTEGGFKAKILWDLYSGIGSIALYLADSAEHVTGIEVVKRAVEDADMNADLNRITNVRFVHGKAEQLLPRAEVAMPAPWAAVVDPPRAGCESAVLQFLGRPEFERLIYVSCDPASLARDLERLAKFGWTVDKVQPVDLFPQTSHVETCVRLIRTSRPENVSTAGWVTEETVEDDESPKLPPKRRAEIRPFAKFERKPRPKLEEEEEPKKFGNKPFGKKPFGGPKKFGDKPSFGGGKKFGRKPFNPKGPKKFGAGKKFSPRRGR